MLQFLDNHVNPLLLRELRQLVRNRFIITLINLYVAVLVLICLLNVFFQYRDTHITLGGLPLFASLAGVMGFICFFAVVVYTATVTASERINGDLMFISSMKPSSIVFGKAFAGMILTVLLMSITAPFVMLAYLLRGLDIEWVAITFLCIFTGIQVANSMAICIFSNVKTKAQMSAVLIGGFFVMIFGSQALIALLFTYARFGGGRADIWTMLSGELLTAVTILSLFLAGAVVLIAPPTSNRMLPIRLTVSVIYFGSLGICLAFPSFSLVSNPLVSWVYSWIGALTVLILIAVNERETWSVRAKRTIPRSVIFRTVLFPFYTGAVNGFVWIALMGLGIGLVILQTNGVYEGRPFYWFLFSFDYCVTAMLFRIYLIPKSANVTPEKTWMIVLIMLLVFVPGGMLAFFLLSFDSLHDFIEAYSLSVFASVNPFLLKEEPISDSPLQVVAAQFWGLAVSLPFLAWFVIRAYRFTPKNDGETLTLEQAVAAVREADANPLVQSEQEQKRKILHG